MGEDTEVRLPHKKTALWNPMALRSAIAPGLLSTGGHAAWGPRSAQSVKRRKLARHGGETRCNTAGAAVGNSVRA